MPANRYIRMNITREGPTACETSLRHRLFGGGAIVTASITNEAVADLKREKGEQVYAGVKASDVMVGVD